MHVINGCHGSIVFGSVLINFDGIYSMHCMAVMMLEYEYILLHNS